MGFLQQTSTLVNKTLLIVVRRHWFGTLLRAILLPILFEFFISYAKNLLVPPSKFGIGSPTPIRSWTDALHASAPGKDIVVFVHNGHTGGAIESIITQLSGTARNAGKDVRVLESEDDLPRICRSSLNGVTGCYGAASFLASPDEGKGGRWKYTLRGDGYLGTKIYVNKNNNDAELYVLPFQRAIDLAISERTNQSLPRTIDQYPFTTQTPEQRDDDIRRVYMTALISFLGVAFYIGICGVVYHLTGQMALERELGISQLIDAMVPNTRRFKTQAARLVSHHLAFDAVYLPSWIVMAIILRGLVFTQTNVGILIVFHLLAGMALSSFSIFGASFFKRAQLSGITIIIISIILAIIAQVITPSSSGSIAICSLLFPSMNYTFFIIWLARWEHQKLPANLAQGAPNSPWSLPGYVFWILLILHTAILPVLGAYVERRLYGTASKSRKLALSLQNTSEAIRLDHFAKTYRPGFWNRTFKWFPGVKAKESVVAVKELSFSALQGQIVVLLGANGSGKSTTLDAIAGLTQMTGGAIDIDGTGGLGLCPQKNVMWDELTVFEHVKIFNRLKSSEAVDTRANIDGLIDACDLSIKRNARAGTLSGGQKRKLQLALMFTGGSRVCCIDEVSSGLDPLSRRKIWDILLRERGFRTLLLTTHFLDEADYLSDHTIMLSKGHLKAEGSSAELKAKYGEGYRVRVPRSAQYNRSESLEYVPFHVEEEDIVFRLRDSAEAEAMLSDLESRHVRDYQVTGPTIEDVFLKLADEVRDDTSDQEATVIPLHASKEKAQVSSPTSSEMDRVAMQTPDGNLDLLTGKGTSMLRQSWVLFRKRLTLVRRSYLPYFFAVVIPIVTAGLVTFFLHNFNRLSCSIDAQISEGSTETLASDYFDLTIPLGPSSRAPARSIAKLLKQNQSSFHQVNSFDDFSGYIKRNFADVSPGGFYLGDVPTMAYIGNFEMPSAVFTQNLLNNILLNSSSIVAQYRSFALSIPSRAADTLQLVLYFGLAMSAFPAFFALYPTTERLRKVRALHYSNGIRAAPLWAANVAFDLIFVLIISVAIVIIWTALSSVWYGIGYLFVVFVLYGLTAILVSYCVSLFVSSQLAAFAFAAGGQAVFFLIYFIAFMCIQTYITATRIDHTILVAQNTLGLVFPSGNLLRSLFLTLNEFSTLCRGDRVESYLGSFDVYGGPILYLILQAIALFTFLVWWDSGYKPSILSKTTHVSHAQEEERDLQRWDSAVAAEVARVKGSEDGLRAMHLTKSFRHNLAIDDVSFGVKRGETFALLGPNGAGKSTIISLIRGDLRPNRGDVLVEGTSVLGHRAVARSHLGVCPQFDAVDSMTVLEHLRFYARARGVPDIEHNVHAVIRGVGLENFQARMATDLSGGNKRKLSLGIALMGNPSVLLLDEPSSGMDAASKRIMWRTLESVSGGRSLLITSHSMEECERLADRAGIMAKRMLALGTTRQLRQKYGNAFQVHIVLKGAPHVSDEQVTLVKDWIMRHITDAVMEDRTFHGQLRFSVPNNAGSKVVEEENGEDIKPVGVSTAKLFALLEHNKGQLGFEYYSVSPTTLDQVFLTVVTRHDVEEEGHEAERPKKPRAGIMTRIKSALPHRS